MKIKKIESICKSDKSIVILKNGADQWLGDGEAMYKLDNMPPLDESTILTLFDVAEKEREKYFIRGSESSIDLFPLGYNFSDADETEQIIERTPITVSFAGHTAIPFMSDIGALYIESRYLAPFHKLENGYELYVRFTEIGSPYIAVKTGLLIIAIIIPCNTFFSQKYADALNGLLTYTLISKQYEGVMFGDHDREAEPVGIVNCAKNQGNK